MKKACSIILTAAMIVSFFAFHTAVFADGQYSVNFGTASWTVDGVNVTATMEDKDLTAGPVTVYDSDAIKLTGFDGSKMVARVFGENDFSAVLEPNGENEVSLGRPVGDCVLPPTLSFAVEHWDGADPGDDPGGDPQNRTHTVDFGSAVWTVDDTQVTATVDGRDLTAGPVELTDSDVIKLTGFDGGRMSVRVYAPDGFSAELEPNGDNEVSLGRPVDKNLAVPPELRFEVEHRAGGDPGEGPGEEPGDRKFTVDFGTAKWTVNGVEVTAVSWGLDLTQGVVELEARDAVRVNGLDSATMQVRVYAEDGFSAELEPNGDNEVSLGRPVDENIHLPDTLRFVVEERPQDDPGEVRGVVLSFKDGRQGEYHVHVKDFMQMTPEQAGITPEEYETVLQQLREGLAKYGEIISVYEIRVEENGAEIHDAQFVIEIDMTDAMLGYANFKLIYMNDHDLFTDVVDLTQKDGKLVGELRHVSVYVLMGEEMQGDILLGDVDLNGKIEAADARLALRIAVGLEPEMGKGTPEYEAANVAEVAKGEVNAADARLILRKAVGFEDPDYGV